MGAPEKFFNMSLRIMVLFTCPEMTFKRGICIFR